MNTVVVDGVTYTKASTLAKKYAYTADYIGQLCRSEKVSCQLVGRSWYVSEDSLKIHKNGRYDSARPAEIVSNGKVKFDTSRLTEVRSEVPPPAKKSPDAFIQKTSASRFLDRLAAQGVASYEPDPVDLLPQPQRGVATAVTEIPTRIEPVIPSLDFDNSVSEAAESLVPLRVVSQDKPKKLAFSKPPRVSLKGQVPVQRIADPVRPFSPIAASFEESSSFVPPKPKVQPSVPVSPEITTSASRAARPKVAPAFTPAAVARPKAARATSGLSWRSQGLLFVFLLGVCLAGMYFLEWRVVVEPGVDSARLWWRF